MKIYHYKWEYCIQIVFTGPVRALLLHYWMMTMVINDALPWPPDIYIKS